MYERSLPAAAHCSRTPFIGLQPLEPSSAPGYAFGVLAAGPDDCSDAFPCARASPKGAHR